MSTETFFRSLGITEFVPGFYDDPAFISAEARKPAILEDYAMFVREQSYSPEYLQRAENVIGHACRFLFDRIVQDGRKGACVDASMFLSRLLDRQGIWNYLVKGSLIINYDASTGCKESRYTLLTDQQSNAPHAFVVAPPFLVVDVTLKLQPYLHGEGRFLPDFVVAKEGKPATTTVTDWFDDGGMEMFISHCRRMPTMSDVSIHAGVALANSRRFGVYEIRTEHARLKYITNTISATDKPLEGMRNLCLSGDFPVTLYEKFLKYLDETL